MGCCSSCFGADKEADYAGIPDERTRLLGSTVRNIQTPPVNGESLSSPVPTGAPPKDEQSALTRILTKTARNVIDVATIEGQGVEQHEYYERARHYSQKVSVILANKNKSLKPLLPNGVLAPQIILAAQPISLADIELISNAAVKAAKAMKDVKVQHKEDLVVAFGVP
ncbi:hypothetical protein CHS0354_016743 [Potamilus streckersoni]|uniref:Ragulator complex protein LAMTOR1 n=1 Tax=Potamilus streckersoni TaxID=2493646 RepID=A0AAE0TC91_9BIVA|nr:hypothetical protein CHS0354_016743 [Potamilus streckersoni]